MFFKRIFDIIFSSIGLVLLSPIMIITAVLIKSTSKGPVIFRQERIGQYGIPFTIYKFRTMHLNHGGGVVSVKGESRITTAGTALRKLKIDELPELWNILIGDMSFVGPRPDVSEYIDLQNEVHREILSVKPGLTSPASLKYAKEEEILSSVPDPQTYYDQVIWPDKIMMNLEYIRNRNFWRDIVLIFRTVFGLNRMPQ